MTPQFTVFASLLLLVGMAFTGFAGAWWWFASFSWGLAIIGLLTWVACATKISMPKQERDTEYDEQAEYYRNGGK